MTGQEILYTVAMAGFAAKRPEEIVGLKALVSVPYCGTLYDVRIINFRAPNEVLELEAHGLPCIHSRLRFQESSGWTLLLIPGSEELGVDDITFYSSE